MKEEKTIRILLVDAPYGCDDINAPGVNVEVRDLLQEPEYRRPSSTGIPFLDFCNRTFRHAYEASDDLNAKIRELTESGEADYVLIGNMLGAGLDRANSVSADMKEKTYILFSDYTPEEIDPKHMIAYKQRGIPFQNCISRLQVQLGDFAQKILEELVEERE